MFKANIFDDKYNNDLSQKVYDAVHIICFFGVLLSCSLINIFFDNKTSVYIAFGISLLLIITMMVGDYVANKNSCAIVMSIIFNFIFMPYIFVSYGKYVCVIPFYFLLGIVYTIFVIELRIAVFLSVFESLFYFIFIIVLRNNLSIDYNSLSDASFGMVYYATIVAFIMVTVCLGAAVRIRYLMYKKEKERSETLYEQTIQSNISKEMFLINMSHEIRTPMNAIVGNANLLLDEEIDNKLRDNVYYILNSCDALLLILDELMDLSKIENEQIEIYSSKYDLKEMITDITNMISVKLMESNLEFFVDVNKSIPRFLIGDMSKIRQIFIYVLNNAIKYTESGEITLHIDFEHDSDDRIMLKVDVIDSGLGINETIINNLLNKNNGNAKSGLQICKELLDKMDGLISFDSNSNKGSKVSFSIPQQYEGEDTVAKNIKDNINVLVVETNELLASKVKTAMESMGILCDTATSRVELDRLIQDGNYTHIFLSFDKFDECDVTLQRRVTDEKIIIISDIGESIDAAVVSSTIIRPIYSVNIASVLNNDENAAVLNKFRKNDFIIPGVTALIVDDNYTNLDVASALLKKYEINVLVASSGKEAIRILEDNDVDIIFMDYMMPELNGIDTLNLIRNMTDEKIRKLPVVALSANVISGAYEMFMQAGFDAFISKPINVVKLEKTLKDLLDFSLFKSLR